jgi:nucleotide-binding universal stress UspA family protein
MKKILAATDLSPRSDRAMARARRLAAVTGAELVLLHVVDEDLPAAVLSRRSDEAEELVQNALAVIGADVPAGVPTRVIVEVGHVEHLLPQIARREGADLVVIGSHRNRGLAEMLGPPTLVRLLKALDAPVLVAVGSGTFDYERVVVGWDFSSAGEAALAQARAVAPGVTPQLVHARAMTEVGMGAGYGAVAAVAPEVRRQLEADLDAAAAKVEGGATTRVIDANASRAMLIAAEEGADLLALGQHARSGIARFFLGATAETVALQAPCDVLIAPPG